MACTTQSLSTVRCNNNTLQGESMQRYILMQFLCKIALNVDPGGGACGSADLLADAEALVCAGGGSARQRMIQAQVLCDSTMDLDCAQPICTQPDLIEAMISILVCRITNTIEP